MRLLCQRKVPSNSVLLPDVFSNIDTSQKYAIKCIRLR